MAKQKKQIDKLTPEQEALIPKYVEEYRAIGLDTKTTDRQKAEAAICLAFRYMQAKKLIPDKGVPEFIWTTNPFKAATLAAQHAKGDTDVTIEEVRDQANYAAYGSFEAYWVVLYAFIAEQLPVEKDNLIDIVKDIIAEAGLYWTFEDLVVICPKPSAIHMKDGKLHNLEGHALQYADGTGLYAVEGNCKNSLMEVVFAARNEGDTKKQDGGDAA